MAEEALARMPTAEPGALPKSGSEATRLFHVIDPRNFGRALLDELCEITSIVRGAAKSYEGSRLLQNLLPHRRAMLYFTQPSTRTFLSFSNACHILGIRTSEIRDPSTSSEVKGETFEDAIRTFSSYVDVIVMRTWEAGRAALAARLMDCIPRPVPVINAGSGSDQHPTQALLDIYTLERSFAERGGIDGKVIGMMGDLKRGRTVRSLCYLMKNYAGVKLAFVAPPKFAMQEDIKAHLREHGIPFVETEDLDDVLPALDALYVTRMQTEWDDANESQEVDLSRFSVGRRQLELLKPEGIVMHPLPRGAEIAPEVDADPRAVYWRQERNGMWMRVAVLIKVLGLAEQVRRIDPDAIDPAEFARS
jgi:aspartate carbamoyltransferase catalytic subunit